MINNDVRVRQRRLYIRDPEARHKLRIYVDQFDDATRHVTPSVEPIIVPRLDSLPFLLRDLGDRVQRALAFPRRSRSGDAQRAGSKTRTARLASRQDVLTDAIGGETGVHHRTRGGA